MISIDQNSNSLWDTLPKLQALQQAGIKFTHFVEDIDVAFTRVGSNSAEPDLTIEQYYRNGSLDWGASLFYMDFLGRCPVNLNDITQYTGSTPAATAKSLGMSVDELFTTYSGGDNWQLTAASYQNGRKDTHRLLGDLTRDETNPFIFKLFDTAEADLMSRFPQADSQKRIETWFSREREKIQFLSGKCDKLAELYRQWLQSYFPEKCIGFTSSFFGNENSLSSATFELLHKIIRNYELFCRIYNESIEESGVELSLLSADTGTLPFFTVFRHNGHLVRSPLFLKNNKLVAGPLEWPVDCSMSNFFSLVSCLTGKALLLVIIARMQPNGSPLALPLHGSLYTPAAVILERKMRENGLLKTQLHPIMRVRLNFLDQLARTDTIITPPNYLHGFLPSQISTRDFAKAVPEIIQESQSMLKQLKNEKTRKPLFQKWQPELHQKINELKKLKDRYGRTPEKRHLCSSIWTEIKNTEKKLHQFCYEKVINTYHASELDYWNSRGAIMPWAIAAGGKEFYQHVISNAQIYDEQKGC